MIIEAISPSLILDEFPNKGSRFTYMLSKPMSLNDVPYSPFLRIYTSPYIKRSIVKDLDDSMVEECIIPLTNEGVVNYMRLSNDREVQVRVLPTQSCTQNVMFLFTTMNDQKPILYTGEFTEYRSIQYNKWFQKVQGQIDHLYIDKTLSQMPRLYENSIPKTCKAIRELVDRFSGYKLHFMIESVGYEDLLVALAKIYDKQVYLDRIRSIIIPRDITTVFSQSERMSKIIVKDLDLKIRTPLAEVEKKFVKDKVITVKFTKEECFWLSKLANYRSNVYRGLCLIQYTPHPSPIDILDFIESAKAKNVHPIQHRSN